MVPTEFVEVLGRLALALVAGSILGWEREARDKPAGLRTHMLVSLGAAVFMLLGVDYAGEYSGARTGPPDPLRVLQGLVGGVGFLGAGAVIRAGGAVHGITTASTIWLAAAVGAAAGMGYYAITLSSVALALVTLIVFGLLETQLFRDRQPPG